jgi:hypothetical protein
VAVGIDPQQLEQIFGERAGLEAGLGELDRLADFEGGRNQLSRVSLAGCGAVAARKISVFQRRNRRIGAPLKVA